MDCWCPALLLPNMEPRRKLRSAEECQTPATDLLENYLSDSSVEEDGDNDQKVRETSTSKSAAASAMKPVRRMRAAVAKVT
jgi:hypothetical protein